MEKYSERIVKGILGYPHRKRAKDLSEICWCYMHRRTLDIGCQDLSFDVDIIPNQNILVGCDLGWEDALSFANANIATHCWNNVRLIKSVGEYLPLRNNFFNMILCFETLEHVDKEDLVIQEIDRVSTKDCILVVSVPIEFGIILIIKEIFRCIKFGVGNYTLKEYFYALICNCNKIKRIKYGHKGYDYKKSVEKLSNNFRLIKKINTPIKLLPDMLSYGTILIFKK